MINDNQVIKVFEKVDTEELVYRIILRSANVVG